MKNLCFVLLLTSALTACTPHVGGSRSLQENLSNPLFAEAYYTDVVERLSNLQIQKDPLLEDKRIADRVETEKVDALRKVEGLREQLKTGLSGGFVQEAEAIQGNAFVKDGVVYFSHTFLSYPGIDLQVLLINSLDPKDTDLTASDVIRLGTLKTPYGTQEYIIPESQRDLPFRTVVLWDEATGRIYAYAQLS